MTCGISQGNLDNAHSQTYGLGILKLGKTIDERWFRHRSPSSTHTVSPRGRYVSTPKMPSEMGSGYSFHFGDILISRLLILQLTQFKLLCSLRFPPLVIYTHAKQFYFHMRGVQAFKKLHFLPKLPI